MNTGENKQNNKTGSIKKGSGLVLLGHISVVLISVMASFFYYHFYYYPTYPESHEHGESAFWSSYYIGIFSVVFIWLIQFIYVIPMIIYTLFRKEAEILKGILITSGITFLLGGGICGAMMLQNMFIK